MDVIVGYPQSTPSTTSTTPILPPRITPPIPARNNQHLKQQQHHQQQQQQQQQHQLQQQINTTSHDFKNNSRASSTSHNNLPEKSFKKLKNSNECFANKENLLLKHKFHKHQEPSSPSSMKVPPIPPRVPLTRSISLTYRPPPPPISDATSTTDSINFNRRDGVNVNGCRPNDNPFVGFDNIPTIVDPLNPRKRHGVPLVRSAPTLNNIHSVNNVNRTQLLLSSTRNQPTTNRQHQDKVADNQMIIPLARWPLTETQPRTNHPFLDNLASNLQGSTNEYVDSPKAIPRTKSLISTLNLTGNGNNNFQNNNFTTSSRALNDFSRRSNSTSLNRTCNASLVVSMANFKENNKKPRNVLKRLKLFVNGNRLKFSSTDVSDVNSQPPSLNSHLTYQSTVNTTASTTTTTMIPQECSNSIICRQCGRCRCKDCMNPSKRAGRIASSVQDDSLLDCLSCMCAIKPIFYHCLKDSSGEDDCSEEPCAGCSQPNCFSRWAILGLFLPCLPCLCLYLPLRCLIHGCFRCFSSNVGCRCERKSLKSSGFKTLLESENSSA